MEQEKKSSAMEEALRISSTFGGKETSSADPLSSEILGSIYDLMVKNREELVTDHELKKAKQHQHEKEEDDQHKEIVDALLPIHQQCMDQTKQYYCEWA